MQTKIAVIGDRGSVTGFRAAGFDVFETGRGGCADRLIHDLAGRGYGIIFIIEEAAAVSQDTIDSYRDQMLPAVISLPGRNGSLGIGMESIHMNVERAAGADIFKKT